MKVLMFGWEFPPFNSGGLGVACLGLTKALASENIQVTFVLPKKLDLQVDFAKLIFADNNIDIHAIDSLLSPYVNEEEYKKRLLLDPDGNYGYSLFDEVIRYARLSKELAKKQDFDLIHAHDWLSFLAGIEAKKVSGKPLIVHVHATEFDRSGGGDINPFVYAVEKKGMQEADHVIAVSNFTKNILVEKYGINPGKISVLHNAVADSHLGGQLQPDLLSGYKKRGYKIVLFVGRLTLQKGPDYFLKTAKKVLEYNPKVLFIIAGSGDMERQTIEQSLELGISENVIFTGFLRGSDLDHLYQTADLFVFPSVSEPFGIAPLESIANGTPVLISKQSGVGEVLSHALKADFWDVDEMTDKIVNSLEHPTLLKTLSENSSAEIAESTWRTVAKKCISIYAKVLNCVPKVFGHGFS